MIPIHPHLKPEEYDLLMRVLAEGGLEVLHTNPAARRLMDLGVVREDMDTRPTTQWDIWIVPTERVSLTILFEPPDNFQKP